ncbi:MAG: hypothetical protein ABI566_04565 [Pseudolysinimonas sp.]
MTATTTPEGLASVGDVVHFKVSGLIFAGNVWTKGQELELTAEIISNSINSEGESRLDRELRNPDGRIGFGPWPTDVPKLTRGSVEWELARDQARREALAQPVPRLRDEAMRKLDLDFGPPPATSHSIAGPSDELLARAAYDARQRDRERVAAESAAPRGDSPSDERLEALMDLARAASFDRSLERQQALDDTPKAV